MSADLRELGRSPIAVVSAGVKSILDIGKTLEYLVSRPRRFFSITYVCSARIEILIFTFFALPPPISNTVFRMPLRILLGL